MGSRKVLEVVEELSQIMKRDRAPASASTVAAGPGKVGAERRGRKASRSFTLKKKRGGPQAVFPELLPRPPWLLALVLSHLILPHL